MVLVIDNYDSFTNNLVSCFHGVGEPVSTFENDRTLRNTQDKIAPDFICVSPGPGSPSDSNVTRRILKRAWQGIPILGVCLGHQSISEFFGWTLGRSTTVRHGKIDRVYHNNQGVFANMPQGFCVTRYHSLVLENKQPRRNSLVTAWTATNEVMGLRHLNLPLEGIQFHPESLFTQLGKHLIQSFVKTYRRQQNANNES